jgi:hypothetical protein
MSRKPHNERLRECLRCEKSFPSNHFVEIEYKKIIEEAEDVINEEERTESQKYNTQKLMICPKVICLIKFKSVGCY